MELYFGETFGIVPQFLACKKRELELWKNVGTELYRNFYRNLEVLRLTSNFYYLC